MNAHKTIIKFEEVCEQPNEAIRRLIGFVKAKYLIDLIGISDLSANPRSAKVGNVTDDIMESISKDSDNFPFKTKGILLAVSTYHSRERKRYELEFDGDNIEGVLDGGHNMLAIALHILSKTVDGDRAIKKVKRWTDLEEIWPQYADQVADIRSEMDFLVPVEVLVPTEQTEEVLQDFRHSILDICEARNNNVQLTHETKANKKGFYESIRSALDPKISEQVEWKTNDGGRIKAREIIALSWIPLTALGDLPGSIKISPSQAYSSKGKCVQLFNDLMDHEEVSNGTTKDYVRELCNPRIASAFALLKDLPKLYDLIYKEFPTAYNEAGGRFGRIDPVKKYEPNKYKENPGKYLRKPPTTPFYGEAVTYQCPEGFITPLVHALSVLMEERNGELVWRTDPDKFLKANLSKVAGAYKGMLELAKWDPQKVGKSAPIYDVVKTLFESHLHGH